MTTNFTTTINEANEIENVFSEAIVTQMKKSVQDFLTLVKQFVGENSYDANAANSCNRVVRSQ